MIIWFSSVQRLRSWIISVVCLVAVIIITIPACAEWQLEWSDDFKGNQINTTNWTFDSGNGNDGWGNRELECYTSRTQNVYVAGGMLHIVAQKEVYQGQHFTSAKLKTRGLFSQKYGRFEFYARLPQGKGFWPALWLMPENAIYGRWAASGEIDVMENRGSDPGKVFGTLHFGGMSPHNAQSHGPAFNFSPGDSANNFHLYSIEWTTNAISWYVDDHLYQKQTNWWSSSNPADPHDHNRYPAPFDQPFYIIMNLAVGGNFGGNPDEATVFPGEMQIKYVRVYGESSVAPIARLKSTLDGPPRSATGPARAISTATTLQPNSSGVGEGMQVQ